MSSISLPPHPKRLLAAVVGVCALSVPSYAIAQDACRDVLVMGLHNTYSRVTSGNEQNYLYHALCDNSAGSSSSGKSAGAGAGIGILRFNGEYGDQNASAFQRSICSKNESQVSSDEFSRLMVATVNPAAVEAWKECMVGGLKANIAANGDQVIITAEWKGAAGLGKVIVNEDPKVNGIVCDSASIRAGTELLSNTPITQICTRKAYGPVTYVLNTNAGSKTLTLRAFSPPQRPDKDQHQRRPGEPEICTECGGQQVEARVTSFDPHPTMSCCNELQGNFTVPPPGVASQTYHYWRAGFTYIVNGQSQSGMAGFQQGDFNPGDVVNFRFPVPKSITSSSGGNALQICIGAEEGGNCVQTRNLLDMLPK